MAGPKAIAPPSISFPLGISNGTRFVLPELNDVAMKASQCIINWQPQELRELLDVHGIPRHHQPLAVRQLAAGVRFAHPLRLPHYPHPLPEERVQYVFECLEQGLRTTPLEAQEEDLLALLKSRAMQTPVTAAAEEWSEETRPTALFHRTWKLEQKVKEWAARQAYCDSEPHKGLRRLGGFELTNRPLENYPLVRAGLAVYLGSRSHGEPVEGHDAIIALKELAPERAQELIDTISNCYLKGKGLGNLAAEAAAQELLTIPSAAAILEHGVRAYLDLAGLEGKSDDAIEGDCDLPWGFARVICEALQARGSIAESADGHWTGVHWGAEDATKRW